MLYKEGPTPQCDHFQQFYNRHNIKVHVPIIRWLHGTVHPSIIMFYID